MTTIRIRQPDGRLWRLSICIRRPTSIATFATPASGHRKAREKLPALSGGHWVTLHDGDGKGGFRRLYIRGGKVVSGRQAKHSKQQTGHGGIADGLTFVHPPGAEDGRRYTMVQADVRKLDASLAKDRGFHVGQGGTGAAIAGRYEQAKTFFARARAEDIPIQAPRVSLSDATGGTEAFIGDGRHRFAALRDGGAKVIPVVVPRGQAEAFRRKFGAKTG
jgi:hypothetical protein